MFVTAAHEHRRYQQFPEDNKTRAVITFNCALAKDVVANAK